MERLFLDPDAINQAYKDLGQSYYRPYLVSAATDSINVATAFAVDYESQVLAPVFSNLFDHCLTVTTAPHVQPEVRLEQTPKPGIIAEKLMGLGIFAALAEAIDAAWQEAWRSASAVKTQRTQIPPTSSAGSNEVFWQEYFGLDLINGISDGLPGDIVLRFDLPPGDSDLLQQSFASALDPIITKSDILKLPGASVEVNGLYADLMHRQLNMLAQLQHGLRQAEADDALAVST
jgi:hypothetical protein